MRRDTSPSSRRLRALHTPSATSAAMKMRKLSRSLLRKFIISSARFRHRSNLRMRSSRGPLRGALARITVLQRHDLHRRVTRLIQEAVDNRAAQQNVPTRTRRLAENDVSDALAPGEIDQRVGDIGALQFDHLGAEFLGETQAL